MDRFSVPMLEQRTEEIGRNIYRRVLDVSPVRWVADWIEGSENAEFDDRSLEVAAKPLLWGGRDVKAMFRCTFAVPGDWDKERVALLIDLSKGLHVSGPDATAYIDGVPRQGVDIYHKEVRLNAGQARGEHVLALKAYSGTKPDLHLFSGVSLVEIDAAARALYWDARVALDAAKLLDQNSYERGEIINALEATFRTVDFREPLGPSYRESLPEARRILSERIYSRQWPGDRPTVTGVGHAHIDVAWLWTLLHTREKTLRTFLTALRLMEQYPEYRFLQSQPQLYAYFKREHPEQYEEVRQRVAEGRWEATGGMWLEADTNITGGESLVRQFLFGKRFLRQEFGVESDLLWLPDVFGYTWSLPQIMARSGIEYFMTTKISWNEFNRFPYDTFLWQGIDGTRTLTHFITTPSQSWFATYNGRLTAADVKGTWDAYKQKRLNDKLLTAFGFGDGGGGPSADMLETALRLKDFPGMPRFEIGRADEFFSSLEPLREELPVWNGEMYLEFHRGTYTSQARTKRYNRKAEVLYHTAEAFAAINSAFGGKYPKETLNQGWELILLNQFHDILPGSSIGEVYQENTEQYEEVLGIGNGALEKAVKNLAANIATGDDSLIVFNPLGWNRSGVLAIPLQDGQDISGLSDEHGDVVSVQEVTSMAGERQLLAQVQAVPSYGWQRLSMSDLAAPGGGGDILQANTNLLESPFLRVEFDETGRITSLLDKSRNREVIANGERGNEFILFEDKPVNNDAWNIDIFYQDKSWRLDDPVGVRVIENGPVRAGLEFTRSFLHSTMKQRVYLYAGVPRIDFETWVDWHEQHLLLKVAFPVAVHSPKATYEIQFGSIERPTHRNTSWDWARFEVPAQRWADLSEGDYGVSLLNDCKYGHDIKDNVMRLTLIKSATSPDPEADQGEHAFTYSLYPHEGDWREGTIRQAADLNVPLVGHFEPGHSGKLPPEWSLVRCAIPNILIETVKEAEEGDGLVVRLYEAHGQRGVAALDFGRRLKAAVECNLLEEEEQSVEWEDSRLEFSYLPYEIRTFKVRLV